LIGCKSHCSDLGEYQMFAQEGLHGEVYRWKAVWPLLSGRSSANLTTFVLGLISGMLISALHFNTDLGWKNVQRRGRAVGDGPPGHPDPCSARGVVGI